MLTVKELLERHSFFDMAIIRHGFTDYMRDYEILIGSGYPASEEIHRYQFVGCVEASYRSNIRPTTIVKSLPDEYVLSGPDYPDIDDPPGFIWDVRYSNAYPGLDYIDNGERAKHWSQLLDSIGN